MRAAARAKNRFNIAAAPRDGENGGKKWNL
jgi:hypothetical protein